MLLAVLVYQFVIAAIIIMGALLKGSNGLKWATVGAFVWTIAHVFVPWLMLLQFFTIAVAYGIGNAIVKEDR